MGIYSRSGGGYGGWISRVNKKGGGVASVWLNEMCQMSISNRENSARPLELTVIIDIKQ